MPGTQFGEVTVDFSGAGAEPRQGPRWAARQAEREVPGSGKTPECHHTFLCRLALQVGGLYFRVCQTMLVRVMYSWTSSNTAVFMCSCVYVFRNELLQFSRHIDVLWQMSLTCSVGARGIFLGCANHAGQGHVPLNIVKIAVSCAANYFDSFQATLLNHGIHHQLHHNEYYMCDT